MKVPEHFQLLFCHLIYNFETYKVMFWLINNCGVYLLRHNVLKITQLWNLSYD